jgi:hypothetical protein
MCQIAKKLFCFFWQFLLLRAGPQLVPACWSPQRCCGKISTGTTLINEISFYGYFIQSSGVPAYHFGRQWCHARDYLYQFSEVHGRSSPFLGSESSRHDHVRQQIGKSVPYYSSVDPTATVSNFDPSVHDGLCSTVMLFVRNRQHLVV